MSKTYLPYDPDQQLLLPAALHEWLPDDHLAYFISDVVDQLDPRLRGGRLCLTSPGVTRGKGVAGRPIIPVFEAWDDGEGVALRLLRRGVVLKEDCPRLHEDIAFRVLAANNTPDFRTISDFRKDNLDALSGLFLQVLALCQRGAGEAGARGAGRHEGQGQRIEA